MNNPDRLTVEAFRREIASDPNAAKTYLANIDRRIQSQRQPEPPATGPSPKERFERWRRSVLSSEPA